VIQAFQRAGCPGCLRRSSILSAAFVAEVGAAIRSRTLSYRTAEITGVLQTAAESAYEQAGGAAYRGARDAATTAEDNFLRSLSQPDRRALHLAEREQRESALAAWRPRFAAEATAAQRRSARRYWAEQRQEWLAGDFLSDLHPDHLPPRTVHPGLVGVVRPLPPRRILPSPHSRLSRPRSTAGPPPPRSTRAEESPGGCHHLTHPRREAAKTVAIEPLDHVVVERTEAAPLGPRIFFL
jgi:hypothetical protein